MHGKATLLLTLLLAARAAAASDTHIEFEAFLDARPVGAHRFDIQGNSDGTRTVSSVAAFDVKILGIVAYRYRHQATTRWQEGCLTQISATTDDNGHALQVMGVMRGGNFELQQPSSAFRAGCVASYAYWDPATLLKQHELLNPQTGQFDAVRIEPMGEETLAIRNTQVKADRYRLSNGKLVIDLWYSKSGDWLQLESTTPTKRKLRYRLSEK